MKFVFMCFFFLVSLVIMGQKIDQMASFRDIESAQFVRIIYDNDYFSATDKDYTQGYSIEFSSPSLQNNPINRILFKNLDAKMKYGLLIEHIGFTPSNIGSEQIQWGDRPFAAAIMLKSYLISTDSIKKMRWSSSLNLGLMGPVAFGNEMQTGIHRAINNTIPEGWRNQIKNDVVINYEVGIEKQLLRFKNLAHIQADLKGKLGTLFTNASLGFNLTMGKINSSFSSPTRKSKFQFYVYAQPLMNIIGYDATLQGGVFNKTSTYTISNSEVERLTYQLNYGVVIKIKKVYLEYSRAEMTKEHKKGENIGWGGVKIGVAF